MTGSMCARPGWHFLYMQHTKANPKNMLYNKNQGFTVDRLKEVSVIQGLGLFVLCLRLPIFSNAW